jgi:hypothetical protein
VAIERDVKDGIATFYIQDGSRVYSELSLPCIAKLRLEDDTMADVLLVQTEYGPNAEVICGCKDFEGGEHVCTLPELEIIKENKQRLSWRFWSKK